MQMLTSVHYSLHQATAKKKKGEIKFKVVVVQIQLTEYKKNSKKSKSTFSSL